MIFIFHTKKVAWTIMNREYITKSMWNDTNLLFMAWEVETCGMAQQCVANETYNKGD